MVRNTRRWFSVLKSIRRFLAKMFIVLLFIFQISYAEGPVFNGEKAFQWILRQTELGPRNPGSEGHQKCLNLLKKTLENYGASVQLQPFIFYDAKNSQTFTLTNIIGSFYPENASRILLCAHWDTRPYADKDKPENINKPILGANDGASGVAVLLEMARLLSVHNPPVGVDIVFFDGEDYGEEGNLDYYCLGSRYFVQNNNQFFPHFAILLDMVGDAQLQLPIEGYSQNYAPP